MRKESLSCSHPDNHIDKFDQMMFAISGESIYGQKPLTDSAKVITTLAKETKAIIEDPKEIAKLMEDMV